MSERVFYFTDSATFGGAEQATLTLMQGLDRARWEPTLVHHPEPGLTALIARAKNSGIATWAVPRMRGRVGAQQLPNFVRELRARRPTVFHAHLTMPLACKLPLAGAALARVPAVIATEHLFVEIPYRLSRWLERFVAPGIHRYIAVSHYIARELSAALPFTSRKIQVVHNGIPVERFRTARVRPVFDSPGPVVLTMARLTPQKGLTYLLYAAAQIPDATFLIAGEGPERAALEMQARHASMNHRVKFLGPREDVPALLASCDVFVLPSLFEGLPLAVLEAMAAGAPVIATDVGGTREAIQDGVTGLLVRPADANALACALRRMLGDANFARRLAEAGQARVRQEFSAAAMVRRTTEIYEQVLREKGWKDE